MSLSGSGPFHVVAVREQPGVDDGAAIAEALRQSKLFRDYQRAFEATLGLPLTLRTADSFRTPLEGSKRINPFCAALAKANPTCSACMRAQQQVEAAARVEAGTRECYAGLAETAVPIMAGDRLLGHLQTGQIFLRRPTRRRFQQVMRLLAGRKLAVGAQTELEANYFQTPVLPGKHYRMIVGLLTIFAQHLAVASNRLLIERTLSDAPVIAKARAYINEHYGDRIGLRDAARAVNMSPFHFCKLFKHATGLTFTAYLARVRIEAVKGMLVGTERRISEAAFAAGFQSLSQFNRVFHRITGESPSHYRTTLPEHRERRVIRPPQFARAG